MIIIKPNCQYLKEEDGKDIEHIAKCAGICYGNDPFKEPEIPIDYLKIYKNLLDKGHLSLLRHCTYYYIIPRQAIIDNSALDINPAFCGRIYDFDTERLFVSINGQYYNDNFDTLNMFYEKYKVSKKVYVNAIRLLKNIHIKEEAFATLRYTFVLTTQISTSRELNRTSPNNICEQSTRYCKFTLPKFGEDVAICQPYWLNICGNYNNIQITRYIDRYYVNTGKGDSLELRNEYPIKLNEINNINGISLHYDINFAEKYIKNSYRDASLYREALTMGIYPQDARGVLPLDTATKVVYTYSYKEWQHIIDLRFHGTTGKPHPNAKEVIGLLVPLLEQAHNYNKNEI